MSCRDTKENFGCVTKWLHGIVAVLILLQILGGIFLDYIPKSIKGNVYTLHKSVGITILFLMVLFVIWRLLNPKPLWHSTMPSWERYLARFTHIALYVGFICMPLTGWILATAADKAPKFYWMFTFKFPGIGLNKPLAQTMGDLHYILAWALSVLIVIHICGALKHHFIDKSDIMKRMCPHSK